MRLKDLCPSTTIREVMSPWQPGWSVFNASLCKTPFGPRLLVRSSNYTMDDQGRYNIRDPEGVIRTRNWLGVLDSELNVTELALVDDSYGVAKYPPTTYPVRGVEDGRLFWNPGYDRLCYIGTLREHMEDGSCQPCIDVLDGHTVIERIVIPGPEQHTKNVVPTDSGSWRFVWQPDPLCFAEAWMDDRWLFSHDGPQPSDWTWRGSTNWVSGEALIHRVRMGDAGGYDGRTYWHAWTDAQGQRSEEFCFMEPGIEFAAGLMEWGSDFIITFGVGDQRCMMARVPQAEVWAALTAR